MVGFFYCTINTLGLVVNNFEPVFNKSLDSLGVTVTINLFILPYLRHASNNVCVPTTLSFVYCKALSNEFCTCDCAAKCIIISIL